MQLRTSRPALAGYAALVALVAGMVGCGATTRATSTPVDPEAPTSLSAMSMLDASDHVAPRTRVAPPDGRSGEWIVFANHTHSSFSHDAKKPVSEMIREAKAAGVDALALTDHDTMDGTQTPEFQNEKGLIMVKGMEWGALRENGETVLGHAGLLGLSGTSNIPTAATLDQMLSEATERGATIIVNHPFTRGNSWAADKPDPRVSAIEVWNQWWYLVNPQIHNDRARDWWQESLVEGRQITAVGGADYHGHFYNRIDAPCNYVFVRDRSQAGILEAIREGRVTVMANASAARLVLEADDGSGEFSAMSGDVLTASAEHRVRFRAVVVGGKGKTVEFYGNRGLLTTVPVTSDDAVATYEAISLPGQQDFVRAELKAHPGHAWSMTAIANPIYLR